ncbi:MAG TPA: glycosyltransferase family 4 protein [Acidimicrobiales bacterium]|nr:glycosyltransferase family 4 protein [Acidimicrobiales bacterium]
MSTHTVTEPGPAAHPLRIAMIGSRGVPARNGGIETVVEGLGAALTERGHDVTVYCRRQQGPPWPEEYLGMRLRYRWAPASGGLAAFVHAFVCTLDAIPRRFDVIHSHAVGPGLMSVLARLVTRATVVTTVHGRDDRRAKWGRGAQLVLRAGVWVSARVPHATIVVSQELADDYLETYGRRTVVVPNAVEPPHPVPPGPTLAMLGVQPGRYALSVGRLVPEKAVHVLVDAYAATTTDLPLLIVGEPSGTDSYVAEIQDRVRDPRIRFVGPHYGAAFEELITSARLFVTASELEGLPTALIEAGLYRIPIVATDIGPHREVIDGGPSEVWWSAVGDVDGLRASIEKALQTPPDEAVLAAVRDRLLDRHSPAGSALRHERVYARRGVGAGQVTAALPDGS